MHLNVFDIALKEFVKIFITYWKRAGFIKHNQFFTTMNQLNWFGQHRCFMPEIRSKYIHAHLHCFLTSRTVIVRQFFSDLSL